MNGCSFQQVLRQKFGLVFVFTLENGFLLENAFQQKDHRSFWKWWPFIWEIGKFLHDNQWKFWIFSNTLTLRQIFWKVKTFFIKFSCCFLVEGAKIENALFPYKTTISEFNVKTQRMVSTKWTYYNKRSFASNNSIF